MPAHPNPPLAMRLARSTRAPGPDPVAWRRRCRGVAWRSYRGAEWCRVLGLPMPTYSGKSQPRRTHTARQVPRTDACSSRFHGLREYVMIKRSRAGSAPPRQACRHVAATRCPCECFTAVQSVRDGCVQNGQHARCSTSHGEQRGDWLTKPTQPYIGECGRMAACRSSSAIVARWTHRADAAR